MSRDLLSQIARHFASPLMRDVGLYNQDKGARVPNAVTAIPQVRDSVCAVLRIRKRKKLQGNKKPPLTEFMLAFAGTAWCVVADRYLVTAHHILNGGKPRDPNDRLYVFTVPGNGPSAYQVPVVSFAAEEPAIDLAILEVGPPAAAGQGIPAVPVTFARPPDGSPVLTYGFPAPEIHGATLDPNGQFLGGGQFFLKGHANEGVVAAQYELNGAWHFEFNVGWHHGESGGPVFTMDPVAAIAIMQHYRNIQTPHGVHPGPHRGHAIEAIRDRLRALGANIV